MASAFSLLDAGSFSSACSCGSGLARSAAGASWACWAIGAPAGLSAAASISALLGFTAQGCSATGIPSSRASSRPAVSARSLASVAQVSLLSSAPAACRTVTWSLERPYCSPNRADQLMPALKAGLAAAATAPRSLVGMAVTSAWKWARAQVSCCSGACWLWGGASKAFWGLPPGLVPGLAPRGLDVGSMAMTIGRLPADQKLKALRSKPHS